MRVFNGYVYVAVRTAIWRHSISDTSLVGAPEQVLDLTQGLFAGRLVRAFSFSNDGSKMYLGSDSRRSHSRRYRYDNEKIQQKSYTRVLFRIIVNIYASEVKLYVSIGSNTATPDSRVELCIGSM